MVEIPFCGQAYTERSLDMNAQRCVNFYPVQSPTASNPNRIVLYPTPGFYLFQKLVFGQARGLFAINDTLYVVAGDGLYSINETTPGVYSTTLRGVLSTSVGLVDISCNTVELNISDGVRGYVFNLQSGSFQSISGGSFPASGGVTNFTYQDGYTLAGLNNSKTIIQSGLLNGGSYGAQAFASVTSFPDNIVTVFSDQLQLYVFGNKLTEVRFNSGASPFAFEKTQGVLIQAGCAAKRSIVKVGNTIIWLASDVSGRSFVASLSGYNPEPVSSPAINEALERYSVISDAFGYSYREGDSHFYCLNFPTANATWCLDVKSGWWHERSYNGGRDLPICYAQWRGKHVVGDEDGNLWFMSQDYSEAYLNRSGAVYNPGVNVPRHYPPKRIRTCQHIDEENAIFIDELELRYEAGVGAILPAAVNDQIEALARNPQAMLRISKDGGHTWRDLGRVDRRTTFELSVTDPVRTYIMGAYAKVRGANK